MTERFKDTPEAAVVAELTQLAQEVRMMGKNPYLVLGSDARVKSLEPLLEKPLSHRGGFTADRVESFIDYVNLQKVEGSGFYVYMARGEFPTFRVIFDDRAKDAPSWGRFSASFKPTPSRQFNTWTSLNDEWISPIKLANFLNNNRLDVVEPDAATMVDILTDIKGTAKVEFSEAVDEYTGSKKAFYAEQVVLKGGSGDKTIPTGFSIGIPIYERQKARVRITCHLKAQVDEGRVKFCYVLDQVEEIKETMIDSLVAEVTEAIDMKPFYGNPSFDN